MATLFSSIIRRPRMHTEGIRAFIVCVVRLRRVVECSSTRTVDNYSGTISRTRIFGRKKKKKKKKCPGPRLPVPGRAASAGMVPSVKMFPNSSTVKLTFQKLGPNVQISVWTWRKMDYSAIFGF